MKRFLLTLTFILLVIVYQAQVPQGISHQAVIRNAANELVINKEIGVKISIVHGSAHGIVVYAETHNPVSNINGLITFVIGNGNGLYGTFEQINWENGPYFIRTEADPEGGTNYSITGTSQILSVPYALHSESTSVLQKGSAPGEMLVWNGQQWVPLPVGEEDQTLRICNGMPVWGLCIPIVNTLPVTDIRLTTASGNGIVVDDRGRAVIQQGFLWSSYPNPDLQNYEGYVIASLGSGPFSGLMTGLSPGGTHYVRAWATNIAGTGLGEAVAFTMPEFFCGDSMITDIDGNTYSTLQVGDHCWFAENLKTTKYRYGMPIDYPGSNNSAWQSNTSGAYAWYENNVSWKQSYGALYNWYAVNYHDNLCPEGWRIADNSDWQALSSFYGGSLLAGAEMKSTSTHPDPHPRWDAPNTGATNSSGFTGLPAGVRNTDGTFSSLGTHSFLWSRSEHNPTQGWSHYMQYDNSFFIDQAANKNNGYSVRCIMGEAAPSVIFAGGNGTESDPFLVANAEQLNHVRAYPQAHFRQINDINIGVAPWNINDGWVPIGNWIVPFEGAYNGNGYSISGLTINRPTINIQGLFGRVDQAALSNVHLTDVNIAGSCNIGGIAAWISGSVMTGCNVNGTLSGCGTVGGLFGYAPNCDIENVQFTGQITIVGDGYSGGGIVAEAASTDITNAMVSDAVLNGDYMGGIAGFCIDGIIDNAIASGTINGSYVLGGLVGNLEQSQLLNSQCHFTFGPVIEYAGGFVGISDESSIGNCYRYEAAPGSGPLILQGVNYLGGMAGGFFSSIILNCGYDNIELTGNEGIGGAVGLCMQSSTIEGIILNSVEVNGNGYLGGVAGICHESAIASVDVSITGINGSPDAEYVGGLVGYTTYTDIGTVTITAQNEEASVSGKNYIAGLAGYAEATTIVDSHVSELNINATGNFVGGLVGSCDCEAIGNQNTGLLNNSFGGNVMGYERVGGMAGETKYCKVENSFTCGLVDGLSYVGGLIGYAYKCNTYTCGSQMQVQGRCNRVGGLIGTNLGLYHVGTNNRSILNPYGDSEILNSFAIGDVIFRAEPSDLCTQSDLAGGFVGRIEYSDVYDSFSIGEVTGVDMMNIRPFVSVGGFFGYADRSLFKNCYAHGNVFGTYFIGGFGSSLEICGVTAETGIWNSYSTGDVEGTSTQGAVGGFLVLRNADCYIRKSYSLGTVTSAGTTAVRGFVGGGATPTPGITDCYSKHYDPKVTHYPDEAQWAVPSNFNFDFNNIWFMNSSSVLPPSAGDFIRPHLQYELNYTNGINTGRNKTPDWNDLVR